MFYSKTFINHTFRCKIATDFFSERLQNAVFYRFLNLLGGVCTVTLTGEQMKLVRGLGLALRLNVAPLCSITI